jgi:hypothetical protein
MASFVESATLKIIDESSGQIAKINAELKKLFATAKSLKSTTVNIKFNTASLDQALNKVNKLKAQLNSMRNANVRMNLTGLNQSTAAINRANNALQRMQLTMTRPLPSGAAAIGPFGRAAPGGGRTSRTAGTGSRAGIAPPATPSGGVAGGVFAGHLGSTLAYQALHGIYRATIEGTKDLDVGENKLAMLQLTRVFQRALDKPGIFEVSKEDRDLIKKYGGAQPAAERLIREAAEEQGRRPGGAFLNLGQRTSLFAETFGTTATISGAKELNKVIEDMTMAGVGMGQSMDAAADKSYFYAKAADMMGRLTYQQAVEGHERGTFRTEGATATEIAEARAKGIAPPDRGMKNFFDYMLKIQPEIGKEMTGQSTALIAKYLGMTRFGVSNRAFGGVLLLGEEMNTRAAVGYRQLAKQLQGYEQSNEKFMNLVNLGLIEKYHKVGKKLVADKGIDEPLLQQSLPDFIAKYIAKGQYSDEAMEHLAERDKRGFLIDKTSPLAKAEQLFKRPFDLGKTEDVQNLASKLVGNSTALDNLSNFIYNSAEIQRKLNIAEQRDPAALRDILAKSLVVTMARMQNQFQGVLGETVKGIAPYFMPALEGAANAMSDLQNYIDIKRKAGENADILKGLMETGATAIFAAPGITAASALAGSMLSAITTPLGMASATQGMMSANPSIRALSAAGFTLLAAGNALQAAAAVQLGALALAGGAAAGLIARALPFLGPVGAAVLGGSMINAAGPGSPGAGGFTPDDVALANKRGEKINLEQTIAALQTRKNNMTQRELNQMLVEAKRRGVERTKEDIMKSFDDEIAARQKELAVVNESIPALEARTKAAQDTAKNDLFRYLEEQKAKREAAAKERKDVEEVKKSLEERETTTFGKAGKKPPIPLPPPRPERPEERPTTTFGGRRYPIEKPKEVTPAEAAASQIKIASDSLTTSTLTFAEVPGRLQSVLDGGATRIAEAGTTLGSSASSVIAEGASSAGTAYGNAAVGVIQAAVANLNLNVNVNNPGAPKGSTGGQTEQSPG